MALTSSSVVENVLDVKRQQLAVLFSVWDTEASGRVHVRHVTPILRAVFGGDAGGAFSAPRIRRAYAQITGRTWQQSQREQCFYGPTLDDLMAMADLLGTDARCDGDNRGDTAGHGAARLVRHALNMELAQLLTATQGTTTPAENQDGVHACASFAGRRFTHAEWRAVSELIATANEKGAGGAHDLTDCFFGVS